MYSRLSLFSVLSLVALAASCSSDDESKKSGTGGTGTGGSTTGGSGGSSSGGVGASGGQGGATGGAAGSSGGAGGVSGASGGGGVTSDGGIPDKLSATGLYSDTAKGTLATGVKEYTPRFVLWTDGAAKKRWVYLPAGAKIDTSDMDYWVYPVGTKLWKEFSRNSVRVETRLLHKVSDSEWQMMAYQWNSAQTDADAVPAGVKNASGTPHDIPSTDDCTNCHGKLKDRAASFTAIQLSHNNAGENLTSLISAGRLTNNPSGNFVVPGSAADQAGLGYLHANCGICHNDTSFVFALVDMQLWMKTGNLGSVKTTDTYLSTANKPLTASNPSTGQARVVPGDPSKSDMHIRMNERGTLTQMPPLGTEDVDSVGLAAVDAWIKSL
ncbi:MAG: hypothetical protein IPI67_22200 [Myxococcales bacterium]|nr:hypothetical protein [Myxococcales bacterium]